jgi:hypothetical protein
MKKSEIEVGKFYSDRKGGVRLVIATGPEYVLYPGQAETDNLRYRLIKKKKGPHTIGSELNSTRISFATWAKEIVLP